YRQDEPELSRLGIFDVREEVHQSSDQEDDAQPCRNVRAHVLTKEQYRRDQHNELLQRVHLDAQVSLEYLVARYRRSRDLIAAARARDGETEREEFDEG